MLNYDLDTEEGIQDAAPDEAFYTLPYSTGQGALSPVNFLIGLIGLLVLMHFIGRSSKTAIQPAHIEIGGYNLLAVTVASITGIVTMKLIFNKWQIPGLTDLINAV